MRTQASLSDVRALSVFHPSVDDSHLRRKAAMLREIHETDGDSIMKKPHRAITRSVCHRHRAAMSNSCHRHITTHRISVAPNRTEDNRIEQNIIEQRITEQHRTTQDKTTNEVRPGRKVAPYNKPSGWRSEWVISERVCLCPDRYRDKGLEKSRIKASGYLQRSQLVTVVCSTEQKETH